MCIFRTNKGEVVLTTAEKSSKAYAKDKKHKNFYVHISEKSEQKFEITKQDYNGSKLAIFDNHLFVNWEDYQDKDYYDLVTLLSILKVISTNLKKFDKVIVNCNWAQSRSPNIVMTFLAKKTDYFKKNLGDKPKFKEVQTEFKKQYPEYLLDTGIGKFVEDNWEELN
jgi:protein tyrosine phosphatase